MRNKGRRTFIGQNLAAGTGLFLSGTAKAKVEDVLPVGFIGPGHGNQPPETSGSKERCAH